MKWMCALLLLVVPGGLVAGTPGVFRGELVGAPKGQEKPGWIYVVSRKAVVRHVNIEHAQVLYAEEVPQRDRAREATQSLTPGAEVMVTAEQDDDGAWHASEVEVLKAGAPIEDGKGAKQARSRPNRTRL